MFPLTTAGLNVSERPDIELYVNLNITYSSKIDLCAGALNMEVDAYKKLQFSFSDRPKTYEVNLWHYGSILTSIQNTFRQRAMDEIESEAKKFVIDWKLDNQK